MAALAAAAGAKDHFDTLKTAFGFGPPEQAIHLKISGPASQNGVLEFAVNITKRGPGVLHNCKFDVWSDIIHMIVLIPTEPITIPNGDFFLQTYVEADLPQWTIHVTGQGVISLICDTGGSPAYKFKIFSLDDKDDK